MTYLFLLLFGLPVLLGSHLYAQDSERVLGCLGYHELDMLRSGRMIELDANTLAAWYALEGEDIWLGYERGGFDIPLDAKPRRWFKLVDYPVEVWVWKSDSEGMAYIFPFPDITPYLEVNGYAAHPCGAFRVGLEDVP